MDTSLWSWTPSCARSWEIAGDGVGVFDRWGEDRWDGGRETRLGKVDWPWRVPASIVRYVEGGDAGLLTRSGVWSRGCIRWRSPGMLYDAVGVRDCEGPP